MQTLTYARIIARAKHHIFGDMTGSHTSKKEGDGYDFAHIRPYVYGDNVKRIDWKKSAKSNELQQRIFFEEKEITTHIIGLMNGSMHFGIARMKQELLAEIIALLGLSAVSNGDLCSISLFEQKLIFKTQASKREAFVREGVKQALNLPVIGRTINWNAIELYALYAFKKSSLVLCVGDFFEIPKFDLIAKKHSLLAIIVRDPFEEKPENIGSLWIKDPISLKEERIVLDERLVKKYTQEKQHDDRVLEGYFKKHGIRWIKLYTHEDPFVKLSSFLKTY